MGRNPEKLDSFLDTLLKKLDSNQNGIINKPEWIHEASKIPSILILLGVNQ
jgi:hypothetical protein